MSVGRKLLLGVVVATFLAAKFYFMFSPKKSLLYAAIPAFLLILSSPANAGASEPKI